MDVWGSIECVTACLSWFVFVLFAIAVPSLSHFFLAYSDCDAKHGRPFDSVARLSLSSVATLSFLCLSRLVKKCRLGRFLFFDKLCDESETARKGHMEQLNVLLIVESIRGIDGTGCRGFTPRFSGIGS